MKDKIIEKKVKSYFNKYFKSYYLQETDDEFKALVRMLKKKESKRLVGEEGYKEFEIETCECGHTVPLGFIQYDENSCGTCVNCVNDELIFRLGKKNKQIKSLKTKLKAQF